MGIADRDYTRADYEPRQAQNAIGALNKWSVTTWLLVINIAVFVLNNVLTQPRALVDTRTGEVIKYVHLWDMYGAFNVVDGIYRLQIWRFITFQFLHASLTHLLFNMFTLYMFGTLIEQYLGRRRFLAFYLLSGIGGGVMYVILWYLGFFGAAAQTAITDLVGASAGIFGVLVAAAVIAPNATVLIYGSIPMKLKTLAYILLGVAVFTIFGGGTNRGGEAAHLGGAVVGFFLIRRPELLNVFEIGIAKRPRIYRR
ncbi:MAG: rhomboid family intramembrane serine protease [Anaerolineae bacterium]|nr:rhomboid family intramembrane serine protease [Phycisphaerae bacterium]